MTDARSFELLRRRDSLRRARQLWVAGLLVWGVVLGWVLFGAVNAFSDDVDVRLSWLLTWLLPVALLACGSLITLARLRGCEKALLDAQR